MIKFKRIIAMLMAILTVIGTVAGSAVQAFAATQMTVYIISLPRSADANKSGWGNPVLHLMGGWRTIAANSYLVYCKDSYDGEVTYCIEPGYSIKTGNTYSEKGESYWDNYPSNKNPTISPAEIKAYIGRIMQYGWQGEGNLNWDSNDSGDADEIAEMIATQLLIWETIVGERDSSFGYVDAGDYGCDSVREMIDAAHPLLYDIIDHYNSIAEQVYKHTVLPSFFSRSSGSADTYRLIWNGTSYSVTLTDSNRVLGNYRFYSDTPGVIFSVSGNKLTISMNEAPSGEVRISAKKTNGRRAGVVTWTDGNIGGGRQDVVTYGASVSDPMTGYLYLEVSGGAMRLIKTSDDGKIGGISFTISGSGSSITRTTNSNGQIDISGMPPGIYTVTEQALAQYEAQAAQQVTIVSGKTATVNFSNVAKRGSIVVTKTAEDGLTAGITFRLHGASLGGLAVDQYAVTGADGVARFDNVPIGSGYILEESNTPARYVIPEKQTVAVNWNEVTEKTVPNILKKFSVSVTKRDKGTAAAQGDASLCGAVYGLYKGGELVDSFTTDENGAFTTGYYLCGDDWTVREITPSEGYLLDDSFYKVGASASLFSVEKNMALLTVSEQAAKGSISITKHTEPAAAPQIAAEDVPEAAAPEAENAPAEDMPERNAAESDLPEEAMPEAEPAAKELLLDAGSSAGQSVFAILEEQPAAVPIESSTNTTSVPEAGAKFSIYLKSAASYGAANETERDMLTCDEKGFAKSKDLPYGVYTVHQESGWEGRELQEDFDVYISTDGGEYTYTLLNPLYRGYVRIVKQDAESGKIVPFAGTAFRLYFPDGSPVTMTAPDASAPVDIFYTGADGCLITPEMLPYGTGYSLEEVQAPRGYLLNSERVRFDVSPADSAKEEGVNVIVLKIANTAQKGVIKISKTGEVFSTVSVNGNVYQPVYEVKGLANAVYEVSAAEDIRTPDGTLHASSGAIVDTITTDIDGFAATKELYLGNYFVREVTAPSGMVLDTEKHEAALAYAGQEIAITEAAISLRNERQNAGITLKKSLETDSAFNIGNNCEIANVSFGVFAAKDIAAADGSVIPADGLIETVSVYADGTAAFSSGLPFGSYYIRELSGDAAYIISDTRYPIEFSYAGQGTSVVKISVNNGKAIENKLLRGKIEGMKKDESGAALGGALIGLFKANATVFTKEAAIMTSLSAENGSFSFANIPYGSWLVREIEAPIGYALDDTPISVVVDKDGAVAELELSNRLIRGTVQLTKTDRDYPSHHLSGAVFEVYADNDGNKAFDKLLGTMTALDDGVYQMTELLYGGYFIKEAAAPAGYIPDAKAYSFSISENGKTVIVENEAGKGFLNTAQTGSIRIEKISEDKVVKGFAFKVDGVTATGEQFSKEYVTDDNGEIHIEGLRVGDYVISEVSNKANEKYELPANVTAIVLEGKTTVAKFYNKLKPIIPDVPKTGDTTNVGLWAALCLASLAGIGVTAFVGFRKKKNHQESED